MTQWIFIACVNFVFCVAAIWVHDWLIFTGSLLMGSMALIKVYFRLKLRG